MKLLNACNNYLLQLNKDAKTFQYTFKLSRKSFIGIKCWISLANHNNKNMTFTNVCIEMFLFVINSWLVRSCNVTLFLLSSFMGEIFYELTDSLSVNELHVMCHYNSVQVLNFKIIKTWLSVGVRFHVNFYDFLCHLSHFNFNFILFNLYHIPENSGHIMLGYVQITCPLLIAYQKQFAVNANSQLMQFGKAYRRFW